MKLYHRIVSLVLTVFLFTGFFSISANAATRQLKTGIGFIQANSLRLRSGPSSSYKTLDYGSNKEVVVVLGKSGSWYKVIYNLQTGYMHSDYLKVLTREDAELGYASFNGEGVKVRSGPGTNYSILTQGSKGSKAYIIGLNNTWFKVIYGNKIGYVRSDYLDLTEIPYENKDSSKKPLFFVGGKSTGVTPSPGALNGISTGTKADQIIATAKNYIGVPYLWGGTTPNGFDCSGFTQYVFKKHGITLLRTSKQQYTMGVAVSRSNLKKGDLVFFNTSGSGVSHLGIYLGNNQFIHASSSKGVTISSLTSSYWVNTYIGARRIL